MFSKKMKALTAILSIALLFSATSMMQIISQAITIGGLFAESVSSNIDSSSSSEATTNDQPYIKGDVDGDGFVTVFDCRTIYRTAAELEVLSEKGEIAADMDGDGVISASDMQYALRCVAKLEAYENLPELPDLTPSDDGEVTVKLSANKDASKNENLESELTLTLSLEEAEGLAAGLFFIDYDRNVLEYKTSSYIYSSVVNECGKVTDGKLSSAFINTKQLNENDVDLVAYTFNIIKSADPKFSLAVKSLYTANGETSSFKTQYKIDSEETSSTDISSTTISSTNNDTSNKIDFILKNNKKAEVGSNVVLTFGLKNAAKLASMNARIKFDSSILEFIKTEVVSGDKAGFVEAGSPGLGEIAVSILSNGISEKDKDLDLINITFKVLKEGDPKLSLNVKSFSAISGQAIEIGRVVIADIFANESVSSSKSGDTSDSIIAKEGEKVVVDESNKVIKKAEAGKSVSEFTAMFKNDNIKIVDRDGLEIAETGYVGTGSKVKIEKASGETVEYTVIVTGDIDGTGDVTASDARLVLRASAELEELDAASTEAAEVDGQPELTASDARLILRVSAELDVFNED